MKKDGAAPIADTRTWLSGAYDFGMARAFFQVGEAKNRTVPNEYRIAGIGARVPVGAGAVLVQWGRIAPQTGADRNTLSAGYDHHRSKRTDVYLVAMRDKLDNLSAGTSHSLGLRHRF